jgi:hypothetical protein
MCAANYVPYRKPRPITCRARHDGIPAWTGNLRAAGKLTLAEPHPQIHLQRSHSGPTRMSNARPASPLQACRRSRRYSSRATYLASLIACTSDRSLNSVTPQRRMFQSPAGDGLSEIVTMAVSPPAMKAAAIESTTLKSSPASVRNISRRRLSICRLAPTSVVRDSPRTACAILLSDSPPVASCDPARVDGATY